MYPQAGGQGPQGRPEEPWQQSGTYYGSPSSAYDNAGSDPSQRQPYGSTPPGGAYPGHSSDYPHQPSGGYPPAEPSQGGYPPQSPTSGGYPPPAPGAGGYPPPGPAGGGYPVQSSTSGGYPPPAPGAGGYPPPETAPGYGTPPGAPPPRKSGAKALLIVGLVLGVLLLCCVGGGVIVAMNDDTDTTSPSAPAGDPTPKGSDEAIQGDLDKFQKGDCLTMNADNDVKEANCDDPGAYKVLLRKDGTISDSACESTKATESLYQDAAVGTRNDFVLCIARVR